MITGLKVPMKPPAVNSDGHCVSQSLNFGPTVALPAAGRSGAAACGGCVVDQHVALNRRVLVRSVGAGKTWQTAGCR